MKNIILVAFITLSSSANGNLNLIMDLPSVQPMGVDEKKDVFQKH